MYNAPKHGKSPYLQDIALFAPKAKNNQCFFEIFMSGGGSPAKETRSEEKISKNIDFIL